MVWHLSLWISGGEVDYIQVRTSEMDRGRVLEGVFPMKHWTGENPDAQENPPEFDFVGNAEMMGRILADYREHATDDAHSQCWADEFMKMYEVGERLQEMGLRPRVNIG